LSIFFITCLQLVNQRFHLSRKPGQMSVVVPAPQNQSFGLEGAFEVPLWSEDRFENLWKSFLRMIL